MTALISDNQVRVHYTMEQCVQSVEEAFAAAGTGGFDISERKVVSVEHGARLLSLTAGSDDLRRLVAHIYSGAPQGDDKIRSAVNQRQKLYVVFDATTGACEAIIGGGHLSWLKTGAMGSVAIKHLASESARSLAIIGSGRQARAALTGALLAREFNDIRIYSRNRANAEIMASEFADLPDCKASDSAQDAVTGADVIITATTSTEPVVAGAWIDDGCHLNSIGAHYPDSRELDGDIVGRSTVVVDSLVAAKVEKGELLLAEREGAFSFEDVLGELGEVVAGTVPWTRGERETTLFASCGSAIESMGAALGVLAGVPETSSFDF